MSNLNYVYSKTLSEEEKVQIDIQVRKNRQTIIYGFIFVLTLSQPLATCAAVLLPLPPPTSISRLQIQHYVPSFDTLLGLVQNLPKLQNVYERIN
jgi:hypothetical protein